MPVEKKTSPADAHGVFLEQEDVNGMNEEISGLIGPKVTKEKVMYVSSNEPEIRDYHGPCIYVSSGIRRSVAFLKRQQGSM